MPNILGQHILLFTAHPDDECYVAAGTIYENYRQGGDTFLVCASYGERGTSHLKRPVSLARMKHRRKRELLAAANVLHIRQVVILGLPDAGVRRHGAQLYRRGLAVARKLRPDVIMSFGPDGISGHYDHITVGLAAKQIARALRLPFAAAALPPQIRRAALAYPVSRRYAGHYKNAIRFQKPTLTVRINPAVKRRALSCHASQMDGPDAFTGFPPFAVRELLRRECFTVTPARR